MSASAENIPTHKVCSKCGERKPIDQFRPLRKGQEWPRHSECNESRNRADRERRQLHRSSRTHKALSHRLTASKLLKLAEGLARTYGGLKALAEHLGPEDAAKLCLRLVEAAAKKQEEAREAERKHRAKLKAEADPVMQRQLREWGLEMLLRQANRELLAEEVCRLIAKKPSLLTRELAEHPAVKSWLTRCGWRRVELPE